MKNHVKGLKTLRVKEGHILSNFDPFDRILLSQAKTEELQFLSYDGKIGNYDEKCIVMI